MEGNNLKNMKNIEDRFEEKLNPFLEALKIKNELSNVTSMLNQITLKSVEFCLVSYDTDPRGIKLSTAIDKQTCII